MAKVEGHSIEQHMQIIKFYYQNQCSVRKTFRTLRDFYSRYNRPAESTFRGPNSTKVNRFDK